MFGHKDNKEEMEIIKSLVKNEGILIEIVEKLIDRLPRPEHEKPIFTFGIFLNNQFYIMSDISLTIGTPKTGIFTLLDANGAVITSASFSNQALGANSNPEFATFAIDPTTPTGLVATPIAAGSGTQVVTTDATWTAADGTPQSGSFTVTKNYTVSTSGPSGATFDVVFS